MLTPARPPADFGITITRISLKTWLKKCLRINPGNIQGIDIEGQAIEGVDTFTYLGSIFNKTHKGRHQG
jgi:hypothetical protein